MRLDHYLVAHGHCETRSKAQDLIRRGLVTVDGFIETKTGRQVNTDSIKINAASRFVGRGGEKLLQAILDFSLDFGGKIVIDIGSSTGGFTDCALQHGASLVHAYDVGTMQMASPLRDDPRVHLREQTNILDVTLPEADIITIDVSFTSVMPIITHCKDTESDLVVLIKPQFEAGPDHIKKGIVKDPKVRTRVLREVIGHAVTSGYALKGLTVSALSGKAGNTEYLCHLSKSGPSSDILQAIGDVSCSKNSTSKTSR